jgi:hypothetical protein
MVCSGYIIARYIPYTKVITRIVILISETGTISKSFRQSLSNIPGEHKIKELQKTVKLGIAHILWKVLMREY